MRTTINIDENVLATARDEARAQGLTLGAYIERALRDVRNHPRGAPAGPPLPVFEGGLRPGIELMSNRELYELLDERVALDKRR